MMKVVRFLLPAFVLLVGSAVAGAAEEKKAPWKASGELEEACSCDSACPCWFDSKPTRMQCSGGFALFIQKGTYGGVPLDGLAMAFMGQSPMNKAMMESIGDWDFVDIYIDEKANPEQRKALEAIAQATMPPAAPPARTRIHYVPITRKVEGSEHVTTVGSVGTFSGHLTPGGLGGNSKIVNPPGADPIHREYEQGRTTRQTYTGSGQKWDWSNTNYMYGTFETDSAEYDKYNAAMMQMMEKMKAEKKK
jgi:hypothetical protein